jgi:hypothetical protein
MWDLSNLLHSLKEFLSFIYTNKYEGIHLLICLSTVLYVQLVSLYLLISFPVITLFRITETRYEHYRR